MSDPLRLAFVEGATPGRWVDAWRQRMRQPIAPTMVEQGAEEAALREGSADVALVRLPIDEHGMHVVRLYEERAVAVVPRDHAAAAFDEVTEADLAVEPRVERGAMTWGELVEVVASGAGIAVMPMSLARLHHRRDVVAVPIAGAPTTAVALAWLRTRDGEDVQALVGIVRGRSSRSSR